MLTREGYCQFLEEDAKTSLPRTIRMKDPDKIFELASEVGTASISKDGRQSSIESISAMAGYAGADRRAVRQIKEALKTRRATSLSRCRPVYPFFRRSGSGPDHNVYHPEIILDSRTRARVSVMLPMFHPL